jgi:hypothetical protein
MDNPFFIIYNKHSSGCGSPPIIINNEPNYYGYFENEYGEQWVFIYNRQTRIAELRGGDVGWENIYQVIDGVTPELILGAEEQKWLQACWKSATANL